MNMAASGLQTKPHAASTTTTLLFTLLVILATAVGWEFREEYLLSPEDGIGYNLGILGGSMMLALLLYPLRKHAKFMRRAGSITGWFQVHMVFGILGPLAILYHCNFNLGAPNSNVALLCMGLMVTSGLIGRFIYSRVHRGLYGERLTVAALIKQNETGQQVFSHLAGEMPAELSVALEAFRADVTAQASFAGSFFRFLGSPFRLQALRRLWKKHRPANCSADADLAFRTYSDSLGKIAGFGFFDRLFSWWHVLHMPIFAMLVVTGLVHVWAVHNY